MLAPVVDGRADMVYGSLDRTHRVMFFWHSVANRLLTLAANMITDLNLSDMETGRKAFLREKLMQLRLSANRFTFEPEITVKAALAQWRIYEVPISYSGRTYREGKKSGGVTVSLRFGRLSTSVWVANSDGRPRGSTFSSQPGCCKIYSTLHSARAYYITISFCG
jgi:hypothetical protein